MNSERPLQTNYPIIFVFLLCFIIIGIDRSGPFMELRPLTTALYRGVFLLSAFAVVLGVINILWVHLRRVQSGQREWTHSLVLLLVAIMVLAIGLTVGNGTTGPLVEWIFQHVIRPLQSALFAITAFFLAAAAYRFIRIGRSGGTWILIGALLMFFIQIPASTVLLTDASRSTFDWLLNQPIMAALRGVLLGSGLALLVIFVRFVLGRS